MNCLSVNIRGMGNEDKGKWIRDLRVANEIGFIMLQETQFTSLEGFDLGRFWGRGVFECEWVGATGRSGGLLSLWDPKRFVMSRVIKKRNYLCIFGTSRDDGKELAIINVYAPQKLRDKRLLWADLERVICFDNVYWIVAGDFNCVRDRSERRNSKFNALVSNEFNDFLDKVHLLEYALKGRKFTFITGNKCSRIDRIFVSANVVNDWANAEYRALSREGSDHCPLVLKTETRNFGPKPFRFFNSWFQRDGLNELVAQVCEMDTLAIGSGSYQVGLHQKLRRLKHGILEWKRAWAIKETEEEDNLNAEVRDLDEVIDARDLTEAELWVFEEAKNRIKELGLLKKRDLKQRARVRWAKEGDENTSFFHACVNMRRVSNNIPGLNVEGKWVFKPSEVKREACSFFRKRFVEDMVVRPDLECSGLKRLSESEAESMIVPFSEAEIKQAVFDCDSDKAPGPDGFNFRFIKRFWPLFANDFLKVLQEFSDTGHINRGVGSSFITLIPKNNDPVSLNEYRPITLIGVISKVISKVLANRIKKVMGSIIHETQSAFLAGRYILDGPLIINEILSWAKKTEKDFFLLKIDFEKAYDNVNWGFLISMMKQMNFPDRWCKWIEGILSSTRSSVLVNGSPTFEFNCEKGIRQGDPISPFLFLIVMEGLSSLIRAASGNGFFHGVRFNVDGPTVSHLLYADDALVMGEWSLANLNAIRRILRVFHMCSGLRINLSKSNLFGLGKGAEEVHGFAQIMGCSAGSFPFKYLGIVVGANMNRIGNWDSVLDIFRKRLSSWKASVVSLAGRVTLIKSVLESLPMYYFSLYKAPATVIHKMEVIIKRFLWGGCEDKNKIHWVAWERVTRSVKDGGLGLSRLEDNNFALLLKWLWRYRVSNDALWKKVVDSIHGSARRWETVHCNNRYAGAWSRLVKAGYSLKVDGHVFINQFKGIVGDGLTLKFWIDPWLCAEPLKSLFPNLFRLDLNKRCNVADRLIGSFGSHTVCWNWKQYPGSNVEIQELIECHRLLANVSLSAQQDRWGWSIGDGDGYTVQDMRKWLKKSYQSEENEVYQWSKWIPRKCNMFMWRASLNRLPTKEALRKRNVFVDDVSCDLCGESEETVDHLFSGCKIIGLIWEAVALWCNIPRFFVFSLSDVLHMMDGLPFKAKKKEIVYGILIVACWRLWKARNDKIFNGTDLNVPHLIADVKSMAFLWFKHRHKEGSIDWREWCNFSFPLM